jgi:DNA mismatch endonuclease (patch repair protein)
VRPRPAATTRRRRTDRSARADLATDPATSARLARVRQRDTAAEVAVRLAAYALGHHFRIHNRDLPGSPDIANRTRKWAIFVHGCFWHRHLGCPRTTTPKRNRAFWVEKFQANRARDRRVRAALRRAGYRTVVVWECESENPARLRSKLERGLGSTRS